MDSFLIQKAQSAIRYELTASLFLLLFLVAAAPLLVYGLFKYKKLIQRFIIMFALLITIPFIFIIFKYGIQENLSLLRIIKNNRIITNVCILQKHENNFKCQGAPQDYFVLPGLKYAGPNKTNLTLNEILQNHINQSVVIYYITNQNSNIIIGADVVNKYLKTPSEDTIQETLVSPQDTSVELKKLTGYSIQYSKIKTGGLIIIEIILSALITLTSVKQLKTTISENKAKNKSSNVNKNLVKNSLMFAVTSITIIGLTWLIKHDFYNAIYTIKALNGQIPVYKTKCQVRDIQAGPSNAASTILLRGDILYSIQCKQGYIRLYSPIGFYFIIPLKNRVYIGKEATFLYFKHKNKNFLLGIPKEWLKSYGYN